MRRIGLMLAIAALAACSRQNELPADLNGRWDVQQIADASLGEGVDIWIEIDSAAGTIRGFTGCNNFSAPLTAFGNSLSVGAIQEEPGDCASPEAATDEARFLGVLPHVQRRIRHGASLELLQAAQGPDALIRLRLDEPVGG